MVVADETDTVFKHQHQPPKLIWRSRFAATIKLRVSFEQAKQLLAVGHLFSQDHTTMCGVADLLRQFNPLLQLRRKHHGFKGYSARFCFCLQGSRPCEDRRRTVQQSPIGRRQARFHFGTLAGANLGDRADLLFDTLE